MLSTSLFAQDEKKEKKERKYSFHFSFDGRRSFVNSEPSDLGGLRFGLEHIRTSSDMVLVCTF